MKIIHPSGKAYHLSPDTQLEIERPNLFFNDYGEQSLPVDLPDSEHNRALMGYPDQLANRKKPSADIVCTLQDGDYSVQARQAILGAKRNEHISTSFYLNDGAFLSKLNNVSLKEVFGDECIPGVNTVEEGLAFCRSLMNNESDEYAIFPLLVDEGDMLCSCLNLYENADFYHAIPRTIKSGDQDLSVEAGYYITPFIRANYLLKRIFEHFGYTLLDNFFTKTKPFDKMVFLNTTADSLINGKIRLIDLLPDVSCDDVLEYYRNSFCCEFVTDEIAKTITIELFDDILFADPIINMDPYKVGEAEIVYSEGYNQICLKYSNQLADDKDVGKEITLAELGQKYSILHENVNGGYLQGGFQYAYAYPNGPYVIDVYREVSLASMPYQNNNEMPVETKEIPAMLPVFRSCTGCNYMGYMTQLFAGEARWKNSAKILVTSINEQADAEVADETSGQDLLIMPSFVNSDGNVSCGMINNYVPAANSRLKKDGTKIFDYSLCPIGSDGLYERFYRNYDNLLRNSLHEISVPLLLPNEIKKTLPAHCVVTIDNQKVFVNKLRYTLGGKNEPLETTFLTTRLYEPINIGVPLSAYQEQTECYWKGYSKVEPSTMNEFYAADFAYFGGGAVSEELYPITPKPEYMGQKFYQRVVFVRNEIAVGVFDYVKLTFWLQCELKSAT